DYMGKRIVGQSIVPGIFKQRDEGEHQIDYGGVEGKDVIATHGGFAAPFAELSKAMRVKKHAVWDKENKKHELEASVETKGLLGTDGRKYVLDLYRITPLDIHWLEKHRATDEKDEGRYPHRMTVLRPELVESYRISKMREYITKELEKKKANKEQSKSSDSKEVTQANGEGEKGDGETETKQPESVDLSGFSFSLNPDVFSGQQPQTAEEKAEWESD
ncbi:putative eukaryotic translation initiation factor 3 subunit CLU1/TIF31, partial [Hortaea werneckii]